MRAALAALLMCLVPAALPGQEERPPRSFGEVLAELREKVAPSVVAVEVDRIRDPQGEGGAGRVRAHRDFLSRPKGPTSGTIVGADGFILTSQFNVSGELRGIEVTLADGSKHEARLVGYDRPKDIALLKIGAKGLPVLPGAAGCRQGDLVAVVGRSPDSGTATLNLGVLSAVRRLGGFAVQTDAELNYGNAGGPLVNLKGEIIGVAGHIDPRRVWGQSSGVGFATKMAQIEEVLPRLREGAKIEKAKEPWVGIRAGEGDPEHEGVQVGEVAEGSPAFRAGLQVGDIITHVGGVKVVDMEGLQAEILKRKIGETVKLKLLRKRQGEERAEVEVEVGLGEEPE